MNYLGILHGLVAFILIGIFHPIVIKAEYYLGRKSIVIFIISGIFSLIASLNTESIISNSFSIFAFCCFWSIKEVIEQEERVLSGRFPKNPKRDYKLKEKHHN